MPAKITTHVVRTHFNIPEQAIKNNYLNKLVKFDPVSQKIVLQSANRQVYNKILGQVSQERQAKAIYKSYVQSIKDMANHSMQKYGIHRNYKIDIDDTQLADQLKPLIIPGKPGSKLKTVAKAILTRAPVEQVLSHSAPKHIYGISKHDIVRTFRDLQYVIEHGLKQIENAHEKEGEVRMDESVERTNKSIVKLSKLPHGDNLRVHDEMLTDKTRQQRGMLIQNLNRRYEDQTRLRDSFFDLMDQVVLSASDKKYLAKSIMTELSSTAQQLEGNQNAEDYFYNMRASMQPKLEKLATEYLDSKADEFSKYTKSLDRFANRSNNILNSLYQAHKAEFVQEFVDQIPDLISMPIIQKAIKDQDAARSNRVGAKNAYNQAIGLIADEIGEIGNNSQKDIVDGRMLLVDYNNYQVDPKSDGYGKTSNLFAPAKVLLNDMQHGMTPFSLRREKFIPIVYQQEEARNQHLGVSDGNKQTSPMFKSVTSVPNETVIFNVGAGKNTDFVRFNQHTDNMELVTDGAVVNGFAHDEDFDFKINVRKNDGNVDEVSIPMKYKELWPAADRSVVKNRIEQALKNGDTKSILLNNDQVVSDITKYVNETALPSVERFAGTRKQLLDLFQESKKPEPTTGTLRSS